MTPDIAGLNHVNVLCDDIEFSAEFYQRLGLTRGYRPKGFPEHGVWLYLDTFPIIHLNPRSFPERLFEGGAVDHFGFTIRGPLQPVVEYLDSLNITFDLWPPIPGVCRALYFYGPSDEKIEFVFVDVIG